MLTEEETGRQMVVDLGCKQRKRVMADSLGNIDGAVAVLKPGLALQGTVSEPTKSQQRTGQLAVLCFSRAGADGQRPQRWQGN